MQLNHVILAILVAVGGLTWPQACLAGPATDALVNFHEAKLPGPFASTSDVFDMAQVAPNIIGSDEWLKITSHEQQEYAELMQRLLMANYANRASDFSRFEFGAEVLEGTEATVDALANDSFGDEIRIVYKLSSKSGSWRLVDVVTDEMSAVLIHRSQQRKIIQDSGFAILLQKIRDRVDKSSP